MPIANQSNRPGRLTIRVSPRSWNAPVSEPASAPRNASDTSAAIAIQVSWTRALAPAPERRAPHATSHANTGTSA